MQRNTSQWDAFGSAPTGLTHLWLTWFRCCQCITRIPVWVLAVVFCRLQSSATRWGTLNLLCLANSWQTECHDCWQPKKYWKSLNQHNSQSFVAGLQLYPAVWMPGQIQSYRKHWWCLVTLRTLSQIAPAVNRKGIWWCTYTGKMWITLPPNNPCFVYRQRSGLKAVSDPFRMLPWSSLRTQTH